LPSFLDWLCFCFLLVALMRGDFNGYSGFCMIAIEPFVSAKESRYNGLIATYLWIYVRQVLLFRSLN
jgi:hypothetical protein